MRRSRSTILATAAALVASSLPLTIAAVTTAPAQAATVNGAWAPVGTSTLNNKVYVLAQEGAGTGTVYAGGFFTNVGGVAAADYITRIDPSISGADWQALTSTPLGTGYTYSGVYSIAPVDGANTVFIGGNFNYSAVSLGTGEGITSWDGVSSSFTPLAGGGVDLVSGDDGVEDLLALDASTTYMVGNFSDAGNLGTENLALYRDGTWITPPSNPTTPVNAIAAIDATTTAIGGYFSASSTPAFGHVATWICDSVATACATRAYRSIASDASTTLGFSDPNSKTVAHLMKLGPDLYAGGNVVTTNAATPVTVNGLAKWNGTAWGTVGNTSAGVGISGTNAVVETIASSPGATSSSGFLYIGGQFSSINGVPANNVARMNLANGEWSSLGCGVLNGVNGAVRGILPQTDGSVIIGGHFTNAGGNSAADYVARYTPGADNCPAGSTSAAPDPAPPAPVITIEFDGNGGTCSPSTIQGAQGTWGTVPSAGQCTYGSKRLAFFSTSPTAQPGATNIGPGGAINFSENNRLYAIWGSDPPSAPTNVVATPRLNSVTVAWSPPTSDGGDPIRVYSVRYKATTDSNYSGLCSTGPGTLQCTAALPATNTQYTFVVIAANQVGRAESAPSAPVSPYDFKDVTASRGDVFLGLGGTKVDANGAAPGLAGQALNVQYKIGSAAEWTTVANGVKVNADARFSWSRKFPASANKKAVSVRFTYGSDAVSGTYVLARGGGAGDLSAPRNIKAKGELNKVALTWDPPKFDGGSKIVGYTMCAQYIGTLCREVGPEGEGDFRNLLPGASYSFTVAAKTAAKTGPQGKADKQVTFTEASVRVLEREPGLMTTEVKGRGFKDGATFRVEVAIVPTNGRPRDTWRWDEIREFTADRSFAKAFGTELGASYDNERIAVRLVTPLGSVYSRPSRPPR